MPAATLVLGIVLTLGPHASSAALSQARPATPAPAPTAKLPPEKLDRLLAPIALYPDQLLTQMLLSSNDAAKIQEMSGWLVRNSDLTGTALQRAAEAADFEPSLVVLTLFPQVVNYMADNIDWTKELGLAFTADREGVLDSMQRLRAEAKKSGALHGYAETEVFAPAVVKARETIEAGGIGRVLS